MAPRLLIIQPSHYRSRTNLTVHKTQKRTLVGMTLPYLAALTPGEWEIRLADEQLMDIDYKGFLDLVAITTWTINSYRAYEIADRFRKQGTPVIMGGPHTYFYAEEAAEHCDAVGVGEGETIWPMMIEDAKRGRLQKIYRAERLQDLKNLPFPRYDLLDFRQYSIAPSKLFLSNLLGGVLFNASSARSASISATIIAPARSMRLLKK